MEIKINNYWDGLQFRTIVPNKNSNRKTCLSVFDEIAVSDTKNSVSHSKTMINEYDYFSDVSALIKKSTNFKTGNIGVGFKRFYKSRCIIDVPTFPLLLSEIILKQAGVFFTTIYSDVRDDYFKFAWEERMFLKIVAYGLVTGIWGIFNLLIAQPLFFLGNTFSHVRHFIDGFVNLLCCPFTKNSPSICFKVMFKSLLNLSVGILVGSIFYGLAALCLLTPMLQPLALIFTSLAIPVHGTIVSIMINTLFNYVSNPLHVTKSLINHPTIITSTTKIMQGLASIFSNTFNSQVNKIPIKTRSRELKEYANLFRPSQNAERPIAPLSTGTEADSKTMLEHQSASSGQIPNQ